MDDPSVLSVDQSSVLQYNLFAYCLNDPVNHSDPSGHFVIPRWILAMTFDALLMWLAGPVTISWQASVAPLKAWSKNLVRNYLDKTFRPIFIRGFLNPMLTAIKKMLWQGFSIVLSGAISGAISKAFDFILKDVSIIFSLGNVMAGLMDLGSDGLLDGKVTFGRR